MYKKYIIVFIVFLVTLSAFGQNKTEADLPVVESHIWKFNFLLPGIEYEKRLGSTSSINFNPYFELGYSSNFVFGDAWLVQPSLDVQLRQYYNLYKRSRKGKRVVGNSANFLALSVFGVGRSIVDRQDFRNHYYYGAGPLWGFQRTYQSKLNLSFSVGPAFFSTGLGEERLLLRLNFRLGLGLLRLNE